MDPLRFRRLMDVVGEAMEQPAAEREAWVRDECGDDVDLRGEALALLRGSSEHALDGLADALDAEIGRAAGRVTEAAVPLPDTIGPYRVREVVGEGGMGIVYGARQEEPLSRDVAIKVVRAGVHAPRLIARFEAERRTLAALDHPGIAHVFDAGTTAEGLPYFAMEWVRGQPITEYCRSHSLGLDARLRLFRKVLAAVHHAHQKAVVHRDLKPTNIMVTEIDGEPAPKIIDFGVARITDAGPGSGPAHTLFGAVIGTLEYMSPEQAIRSEEGVDIRADVYALGVLLYELLTGELPFPSEKLRGASPTQLERLLRDVDPPPPSRRLADPKVGEDEGPWTPRERARWSRALRGDLDNVVAMAIRKDRARRYASVAEFDDDLARYMEGHPVRARPSTRRYRARRFVGRHRAGVFGSVAAGLLLLGTAGAFTFQLAGERDRARLEAEKTGEVADFLQRLFEVSDPSVSAGETMTARELLDEGAHRIGQGLVAHPEVQARMMRVMGGAYQGLGLFDEARPLLEEGLARHLALYGESHEEVAASQAALGGLLSATGELARAEALHRAALETRVGLFGPRHPRVGESLGDLARVLERSGDSSGAEELYTEALDQARTFHSPGSREIALLEVRLGGMLRLHGRFDEAEPLLRSGLASQRAYHGDRHPEVANALRNLAALLRERGDYEGAADLYGEALVLRRGILGDDHPEVATTLSSYGLLLQRTGRIDEAITALEEAVRIMDRAYPEPHANKGHAYHNLGLQHSLAGRYSEAMEWFERAREAHSAALPEGHSDRAHPLLGMGWIHMNEGRPEQAEALFREALAIRRDALHSGHRDIGGALSDVGASLAAQERFPDAESALLEAHAMLVEAEGPDGRRATRAAARLASLYDSWGRPGDAARYGGL